MKKKPYSKRFPTLLASAYPDKVKLEEVHYRDIGHMHMMAVKAGQMQLADIKRLDTVSQMAVCLLISKRVYLMTKAYAKEGALPFSWTIDRALLLGMHHLLTHSQIMEEWDATELLQLLDKYK